MRDAQVRHVAVVNDVDRLVAAISIDHLVLVAQNVGAGADAANIVRFHAFRAGAKITSVFVTWVRWCSSIWALSCRV